MDSLGDWIALMSALIIAAILLAYVLNAVAKPKPRNRHRW